MKEVYYFILGVLLMIIAYGILFDMVNKYPAAIIMVITAISLIINVLNKLTISK